MIIRTFDYDLIMDIMTHPDIYPYISDDGSPSQEDFSPIQSDDIYYLICEAGLFMYHPHNCITVEVHSCVLPEYRGKSVAYAKASVEWMFENTKYRKVITQVPSYNKRALVYAQKAGLEIEGTNRMSFMKNGKIYDQTILGVVCQPQH